MAAPNPPLTPDQKIEQMQAEIDALKDQQNQPKAAGFWSTIFTHWKSTANGILGALLGVSGPATALLGALQAMKPTPDYRLTIAGTILTFVFAVARAWIGMISKDASALTQADISKQTAVATAKQA